MVGVAEGDEIVVPGVGAGHQDGEIVRLRAGVYEITDFEFAGHLRGELLGIQRDLRVQIDRGGVVDRLVLPVRGLHHFRVAVPDADGDDAAEAVEIAAAGFVEEILRLAFDDGDRLLVVMENRRIHELVAEREDFLRRRSVVGLRGVIEWRERGHGGED